MCTQKQIAASRENGRKSHGAATPEGKARIVQANLVSGIYAEDHVLRLEWDGELQEMKEEYYARHRPASPEARCLLDQAILCEYHLRRFSRVEDDLWTKLQEECPRDDTPWVYSLRQGERSFARLQHRINSTRRAFQAALKELERLEARDQDVVIVERDDNAAATGSSESHLPILGSLRKNDAGDPAAHRMPPTCAPGFSESVAGMSTPADS